jgi:hypothetical protein
MRKKHLYSVVRSFVVILFIAFSILPAPARAEQCYSPCKEGLNEYKNVSWVCTYDRLGNQTGYGNVDYDNYDHAKCQMTVKGQYKNVMLDIGHVKSSKECLEDKCIPKVEETCGPLDRCADPKNWRKW